MTLRADESLAGALRWVGDLLAGAGIPFLVAGDVAALAYGVPRPIVAGIEIFVAAADLPRLLRLVEVHVVEAPWRRRDDRWDRIAAVLEHDGARITVGLVEAARVRDSVTGAWMDAAVDLDAAVVRALWGTAIPVLSWESLAGIERRLGGTLARRDVDRAAGGGRS